MYATKIKFLKLGIDFTILYEKLMAYKMSGSNSDEEMDLLYKRIDATINVLPMYSVSDGICAHISDILVHFTEYKIIDIYNDYQKLRCIASIKEEDLNLDEAMMNLSHGRILYQIGVEDCEKYISFFEQFI